MRHPAGDAQRDLHPLSRRPRESGAHRAAGLAVAFRRLHAGRYLAVGALVFGLTPYLFLRGVADDTGIPRQPFVARVESAIAGGALPTEHLQHWLHHAGSVGLFDHIWLTVYALWFPVAVLGMVCFAIWQWGHFRAFAFAWLSVFYVPVLSFALFPTEPPWMLSGVTRVITEVSGDLASIDTNQVAAFPSLHVAVPAMIAFRARASGMRRLTVAYGLFAALTAFAVVYLGEHFVLDAIAGVGLAWFVVNASGRYIAVERSQPAEDSLATPSGDDHVALPKVA